MWCSARRRAPALAFAGLVFGSSCPPPPSLPGVLDDRADDVRGRLRRGVPGDPERVEHGLFAVYWLFGAVLNVPFLAAGEVLLLFRSRAVEVAVLLVMVFVTAFAFNAVRSADMRGVALECRDLPLGKAVFSSRPPRPATYPSGFISVADCESEVGEVELAYRLAQYLSYPAYVILVAGTIWSAIRMRGRPDSGTGSSGRSGSPAARRSSRSAAASAPASTLCGVLSIGLAAGIVLMFWGFLRASRRVPRTRDGTV